MRSAAAVTLPIAALALLAGCTAAPVAAASSPVALTAVTTATRTAKTPIDQFDAWYFCRSDVFESAAGTKPSADPFTANPYSAKFVRHTSKGYRVQIVGKLGDGTAAGAENASYCVVAGTLGHPTIVDALYPL